MQTPTDVTWNFYRIGGLDQVTLKTANELQHLRTLDPKLWAALSCPTTGLEFDARTLALIDTDHDERIRIPEVLAAVEWLCNNLTDPSVFAEPQETFSLSLINTQTKEGKHLEATGRAILQDLGKDGDALTQKEILQAAANATQKIFNGDGIVPAHATFDADVRDFITDALQYGGGLTDASGNSGINQKLADAFVASLKERQQWKEAVAAVVTPFAEGTVEAWALLQEIRPKVDDYFLRCELASFAPVAVKALNADEELNMTTDHKLLDVAVLQELPLARIEGDRPLPLGSGLNPAWRSRVERFFVLAKPLLAQHESITRQDWEALQKNFATYEEELARKPEAHVEDVTIQPTQSLDAMSDARRAEILSGQAVQKFQEIAAKDTDAPTDAAGIYAVEKLVLYYFHLHRLLMNFVSFYDFYSLHRSASFQSGSLYLDGRSCRLCLPVTDIDKHASLAGFSQLCLVYCECRRRGAHATDGESEQKNIVAAVTAGDAALLMVGRNGIYVDNMGNDWDATLVKIVSNPISLRQAIWEPYRRVGRMISSQVAKIAGTKQAQQLAAASSAIKKIDQPATPTAATPAPFDMGRNVGIFAAVGIALGALGTAVATMARTLMSLTWWQFPLLLLAIFVLISGPSLILAWLKLRRRTLGPLLEASGWAVNSRIPINLALGAKLTDTATLPENSTRSFSDPFFVPNRWPFIIGCCVVLALLGIGGWLLYTYGMPDFIVGLMQNATAHIEAQGNGTSSLDVLLTNSTAPAAE